MTWLLGFMSPRLWIALAVVAGLGFSHFTAYRSGRAAVRTEWTAATLKATEAARQTEANWQTNLEAQNELDQKERQRMAAAYDRGIAASMRNRAAARMPETAASACAGASPAQLAGPDAAAFERLGRDARAVQLDLEKARAWIETVTKGKP